MYKLFKAGNGMSIVGQGARIILFTLPSAAVAVAIDLKAQGLVRLPLPASVRMPLGFALLTAGALLWLSAVVQLLVGFPAGKLVTTGAYSVCRNPIYASFALFILPGVALLSDAWVYFFVSLFLIAGVEIFIRKEERQLGAVFGAAYDAYTRRVGRIVPFLRSQAPRR